MKKTLLVCGLAACLGCVPMTAFAAENGEKAAKKEFREAIAEEKKEILENEIALDEVNASNKAYRLEWMEAKEEGKVPKEAKELVAQIHTLQSELKENAESLEPYREAKKACAEELNAGGAKAAMENMIRIQEEKLKAKQEINGLWKKVSGLIE